ncbi:MAG: hypothetical protein J7K47_04725 [Thermoplasmata archaeon]|nr:hypothetical protein [Thermoplasmata archaeon]
MYGKKLVRKIGSLVVIATLIASAFAVLQIGEAVNGNSIHDVGIDTSYYPEGNGIKIFYNGNVVNTTESLFIGNEYTIRTRIANFGDFNESVGICMKVVDSNGSVVFGPETRNTTVNDTTDFWRTWDTTGLMPGEYTIIVNASIANDSNMSNNIAQRTVMLEEYVPPVSVELLYPVGGEIIGGIIPIKWNASSSTGSELTIKLEYKNESGEWHTIASELGNTGIYYWNSTGLEKGKNYTIRITATDEEENNATDESAFFTISQMDVTPYMAYYNETKTIDITGCTGIVKLWYPTATNPTWPGDYELKDQRDGSVGNARFSNVLLSTTGPWIIQDEGCNALYYILVKPIKLNVTVSPSSFDFTRTSEGWVQLSGNVKYNENPMKDVIIEVWAPGQKAGEGTPFAQGKTDANGSYTLTDVGILTKGAGKYNITARIGDFANPNAFGYTIFTVNNVEANITLKNNTAKGGFNIGEIIFEITDSNGNAILTNDYNISVLKDGKPYAWLNTSGGDNTEKMNFEVNGKILKITSNMWEADDYTLSVKADIVGSPDWEYIGSIEFTVQAAPNVNMNLLSPATINVSHKDTNVQMIQVQIFGENMTTFADEEHGFTIDNLTKRIKVEGDVLYSPPKDAYHYWKDGIWNITVFPAYGNGKIYVNVTWPDKGSDSVVVNVKNGGKATAEPTEIIVDTPTDITVTITKDGQAVPYVDELWLYYEMPSYWQGTNWVLIKNVSGVYTNNGAYTFTNISSEYAGVNIIAMAKFYGSQYAYALIKSKAAHDLSVEIAPDKALAGEKTTFKVNITKDGKPYDDESGYYFYVLNESQLTKLHNGEIEINDLTPIAHEKVSQGNYTFEYITKTAGTYYLYVTSQNKKHDIPADSEPSFEVTKANVAVSPTMLVKRVDKNMTITFTVTWNGKTLNGTLRIYNITALTNYAGDTELEVENGEVNITGVDAIATGNITFEFKPKGTGNDFAPAGGMLKVTSPEISIIEPANEIAYIGVENLIIIEVTHPLKHEGCGGLNVTVEMPDGSEIDVGKTGNDGKLSFGVIPLETGKIYLKVEGERVPGVEIDVGIGLRINAPEKIEKGKEMTIVVTTLGGNPVKDAIVKVDGSQIGTTDANGIVKYKPENSGTITITAEKEGYYKASVSVEVTKPPKEQPGFELLGFAIALLAAILIARRKRK